MAPGSPEGMSDEPIVTRCHECAGTEVRRIVYGLIAGPLDEGSVAGGCTVSADSPDFVCVSCGAEWVARDERRDLDRRIGFLTRVAEHLIEGPSWCWAWMDGRQPLGVTGPGVAALAETGRRAAVGGMVDLALGYAQCARTCRLVDGAAVHGSRVSFLLGDTALLVRDCAVRVRRGEAVQVFDADAYLDLMRAIGCPTGQLGEDAERTAPRPPLAVSAVDASASRLAVALGGEVAVEIDHRAGPAGGSPARP